MAHTWRIAFGLGLLGAAITAGCTVTTDDSPDSGFSGEAGEGATGGSGGSTGGSGGKGGASGGTSGKGGNGGTSGKGGASSGGTGGTGDAGAGAEAGAGATTGGTAGAATGGSAGMAGTGMPEPDDTVPECDPPQGGDLENTPYPGCEPEDPSAPTDCEACTQRECCDESIACYSFAPGNVCGWGGPDSGEMYAGAGEIGCYIACLFDYTEREGLCDSDGVDLCIGMCQTTMCSGGVLGNQTSELAGCLHDHCSLDCFGAETCD